MVGGLVTPVGEPTVSPAYTAVTGASGSEACSSILRGGFSLRWFLGGDPLYFGGL